MLNGNRNPECVAEHLIGSCKKLLYHSMADPPRQSVKMKDHSTKHESVFKLRSNVKGVETNAPKNVYKSRHIEINRLGSGVPNGAARQNTRSSCRI